MNTTLALAQSRSGKKIVEVRLNGKFVAAIYPEQGGIKVISAHVSGCEQEEGFEGEVLIDDGSASFPPIPAVYISFLPGQYRIVNGAIEKTPGS